jgi:pimeloyl-ACP methyl ester carboxylesterase
MPPNEWNLDDYVEFVAEFVGKLNIAVDAVVGHSFGGRIIIKGVASENIRTEKIVLIASAGVAERHTVRRSAIKSATKLGSAIAWLPPFIFFRRQLRSKLYESIGSDYLRAGSMKNIYLNIIKEDLSSSARQIKCPALLIWGDRDATTPMREGLRFSKLIEKSTLKVIEGAGHFVHQQQARKVAAYINEFIT